MNTKTDVSLAQKPKNYFEKETKPKNETSNPPSTGIRISNKRTMRKAVVNPQINTRSSVLRSGTKNLWKP